MKSVIDLEANPSDTAVALLAGLRRDADGVFGSLKEEPTASGRVSKTSTGKKRYHTKSRKGCATCKRRRVKW
ncbi:unnamed protein product [Kuraishia capsulata CBS 1993]|uniref:Uncharacterized protein n=1 Tax=Kuraishia capsulata CBS 1993 TaxID=1382522 RepID=W6MSA2_9ASCO|nr:uncharacterized protein KUCA_T00005266001 [Kuraishia capsulata CBS 1993]CDK29278.1 unnamed protein product [Kuraishia capsulata CBS 1993]